QLTGVKCSRVHQNSPAFFRPNGVVATTPGEMGGADGWRFRAGDRACAQYVRAAVRNPREAWAAPSARDRSDQRSLRDDAGSGQGIRGGVSRVLLRTDLRGSA